MNNEQREALNLAENGHNLLLIGSAGTGKSYAVERVYQELKKKEKNVHITCSTGIACSVYPADFHARTIHQFAGIDDGRHDPETIQSVLRNNPNYAHVLASVENLDCLILDECSMISQRSFETLVKVLELKDDSKLCGGIQLIFVGDFLQLPPVPNKLYNDDGKFCFESKLFDQVFPHRICLKQTIRQQENDFIQYISDISQGHLSRESEKFRQTVGSRPPFDRETVKLFSTNLLVDDYNRRCLLKHPGILHEFHAKDSGEGHELDSLMAPRNLWIKKDCPVLLLKNLSSKLVNGLRGVVTDVDKSEITVHFPSINSHVPLHRVLFTVYDPRKCANIASRKQFPIKPAFGLTIHKAQGMTLPRVEVNCKDIFRYGQLGVAVSRASSSSGLRVVNFHPRYLLPPPQIVTDFIRRESKETKPDLTCCRNTSRTDDTEVRIHYELGNIPSSVRSQSPTFPEEDDFDDDFNEVIQAIGYAEEKAHDFALPDNFDVRTVLTKIRFSPEHTDIHVAINQIISDLDPECPQLVLFVKKIFLKITSLTETLRGKGSSTGVPESPMTKFYQDFQAFTTSSEYIMSCLFLFHKEPAFSDQHKIICYRIVEEIRIFLLQQKVDLLSNRDRQVMKRYVTDASKPRIRYVAGHCLASLRKKYVRQQKSRMFNSSAESSTLYEECNHMLGILNMLKEEEHFLQKNTNDPNSLIDVERRQNINRGLTNVADSVYTYFLKLSEKSLSLLVSEKMLQYGKTMYNMCLENLLDDTALYEQFVCIVAKRYSIEEVGEETLMDVESVVKCLALDSELISRLYKELVSHYLSVLFNQFRKDVKTSFQIEKKMAHRKQIKVSSKDAEKGSKSKKKAETESVDQRSEPREPQPGTSREGTGPKPGTSTDPQPGTSRDDTELTECCQKCSLSTGDQWVQCNSCCGWYHRKCAGLSHYKRWAKFKKKNAQWFCQNCE